MPSDSPPQRPESPPRDLDPRAVDACPAAGLVLERGMRKQIIDHLRVALPAEGCGLLATALDAALSQPGGPEWAMRFYPGTNIDASATRYTMEPAEVLAALRDMEARGWRLGAIVHSHPAAVPTPSPTDRREAYYPGALLVIVSFVGAVPEMRAWAAAPGVTPFAEAPITVVDVGAT